ncbi:hypothetical protein TNCV_1967701 [Trichonephila clavipes]|nr:hypothetical protein TNCV_1967701 [Trichonephila clavipes]
MWSTLLEIALSLYTKSGQIEARGPHAPASLVKKARAPNAEKKFPIFESTYISADYFRQSKFFIRRILQCRLEQRANIQFSVMLKKLPSETLKMLKKAYGNDSSCSGFLPVSLAEKEIEGKSGFFC